ncbi:MAG: hypothetical protein DRI90_26090 [Deltaproteobacteria bacterium]|nr:MAG: hypothetical protein DRI90_26090 [Deltaproteobacteria bacterium]
MPQELSDQQQKNLEHSLALVQQLLAISAVAKHDTRFEGEVALVAPGSALDEVAAKVEEHLGAPKKTADAALPADLADSPLVDALGGIRGGQTLYVKELGDGLAIYVAFWPWGGGKRFTIKIGVHDG